MRESGWTWTFDQIEQVRRVVLPEMRREERYEKQSQWQAGKEKQGKKWEEGKNLEAGRTLLDD